MDDPTFESRIAAVQRYVTCRYHVPPGDIIGLTPEDEERLVTDDHGYVQVRDVVVDDDREASETHSETWYVRATAYLAVHEGDEIEGATDIYEVTMYDDGTLDVEWYGE